MSGQDSSLNSKLRAALISREERLTRRRLPDPSTSDSIDFTSNDYLSLSVSPILKHRFLSKISAAPDILGSGGSRLLVHGPAHRALENRLANFFRSETALLFNSGFDANVGFFSCVPQTGDVVVHDEYIHASIHDGIRASRIKENNHHFDHNSIPSLRRVLTRLRDTFPGLNTGRNSLFVAVESLYSMDGTFAPLTDIVDVLEDMFKQKNAYLIVDEAHATGIYGPQGRGRVAELGLESKVLARLHTFGKALAATGAVVLTSTLIRDYLLNYARPLIYTTSLSYVNIIAADCSFDLLVDGTAQLLAHHLLSLSTYFVSYLRPRLIDIPPEILSLPAHLTYTRDDAPSQIIPLMTSYPRPLSAYLLALGMNARPITWPTVPKGKARVRVCLHAGNALTDVERLAQGVMLWARETLVEQERAQQQVSSWTGRKATDGEGQGFVVESKL